jgi:hypothetical protein
MAAITLAKKLGLVQVLPFHHTHEVQAAGSTWDVFAVNRSGKNTTNLTLVARWKQNAVC